MCTWAYAYCAAGGLRQHGVRTRVYDLWVVHLLLGCRPLHSSTVLAVLSSGTLLSNHDQWELFQDFKMKGNAGGSFLSLPCSLPWPAGCPGMLAMHHAKPSRRSHAPSQPPQSPLIWPLAATPVPHRRADSCIATLMFPDHVGGCAPVMRSRAGSTPTLVSSPPSVRMQLL